MSNKRKLMMQPVNLKFTRLFIEFFQSEQSSGIILIACTISAILIANSPFGRSFLDFWHLKIGYVGDFSFFYLILALSIFGLLLIFNRLRIHNLAFYLIPGFFMWYFMLRSGVHATLAGVLLAFAIPFGDGSEKSPSYGLQHVLHKPVAFGVMPAFALANTEVQFTRHWLDMLTTPNSLGVNSRKTIGNFLSQFYRRENPSIAPPQRPDVETYCRSRVFRWDRLYDVYLYHPTGISKC